MRTKVNTKETLTAKKTRYMHNKEWYCDICQNNKNYSLGGKTQHIKTIKHHMAWIESYERQIEAEENDLNDMRMKIEESKESPMCSICNEFQKSHTLVTGRGYFHETGICDVCCNKIREFNDYQKDVIDYITIH